MTHIEKITTELIPSEKKINPTCFVIRRQYSEGDSCQKLVKLTKQIKYYIGYHTRKLRASTNQ